MSSVNNNLSQFGRIDRIDALKKVIALKLHGLTINQLNEVLFNINAIVGGVQLSNQVLYDAVKEKQALRSRMQQLEQLEEVQQSNQQLIKQLNSKRAEGVEDVQPR